MAKSPPNAPAKKTANPTRLPGILRPMVPSPELAKIVGDHAMPRPSMIKKISDYAKKNGLQDSTDHRVIHADNALQHLLGVDSLKFLEIPKYLTGHLRDARELGGRYAKEAEAFEEEWVAKKKAERNEPTLSGDEAKRQRKEKAMKEKTGMYAELVLSDELSAVCQGKKLMSRQDIIKSVWHYIHMNNLSAKETGGSGIKTDFLLKRIFNADTVKSTDVMKAVSRHVSKKP